MAFLLFVPRYWRAWNIALAAPETGQWQSAIPELEEIHRRGYQTDESRFWLACAYGKVSRWQDAVAQLSAIERPLSNARWEGLRYYNHAVYLARMGNKDFATRVLEESRDRWPAATTAELAALLESLAVSSDQPLGLPEPIVH